MTTNNTMSAKAKKIAAQREAYRDLMQMTKYFNLEIGKNQKEALSKTLFLFGAEGCPVRYFDCQKLLEPQRRVAQLLLAAGADPNYSAEWSGSPIRYVRDPFSPVHAYRYEYYDDGYSWHGEDESVFEMFVRHGKPHCAMEIAKADGFVRPTHLDEIFERLDRDLHAYMPFECAWEFPEDFEFRKRLNGYQKGLVQALFKKKLYPAQRWLFHSLSSVASIEESRLQQDQFSLQTAGVPTGGRSGASR